ncbi:MAG: hypothetical protein WA431_07835 [Candidatus Cybelea sp.]
MGKTLALRNAIDEAIATLPPLDRTILHRCDIDREIPSAVAAEVGISERHLYRKRARIFERLASLFVGSATIRRLHQTGDAPDMGDLLAKSRALQENGAQSAAIDLLENLASQCGDRADRVRVLLRLAELYASFGLTNRAQITATAAAETAAQTRRIEIGLEAEMLVARASILDECIGSPVQAEQLARHAADLLTASQCFKYDPRSASVLILALCRCCQVYAAEGQLDDLRLASLRAREVLAFLQAPSADTQIEILFADALMKSFCLRDLEGSKYDLSRAMDIAQKAGFTLSSIMLATNLADVFNLQGNPTSAANILIPILPIARSLGNRNVLLGVLLALGNSLIEARDFAGARDIVEEAMRLSTDNKSLNASRDRAFAKVKLGSKDFIGALDISRVAQSAFARIGKSRLIGMPLLIEAEALASLGHRQASIKTIRSAIDALTGRNHPAALARAYDLLGRISGKRTYRDYAKRLKLEPPAISADHGSHPNRN